jgi:hypothetical protein
MYTSFAILTLTITETTGSAGYLTVHAADDATSPNTSNINWFGPGQTMATTVVTALDVHGQIKVDGFSNDTHFIVDVTAYAN